MHRLRPLLLTAALLAPAVPALALYKVIGPDGKVTYTDRPPATTAADRVVPMTGAGTAPAAAPLPLELRQAASRYPVTLYVTANCEPCDAGRALLRQRGVPHNERQIVTTDDSDALQRISGARTAPTLTIGQQAVKGLSPEAWNAYLDSAGYPRESRLPANYQFAPATPLIERREAARPRAASASLDPALPRETQEAPASSIRF